MKKLLIIDTFGLIFRAYHAYPMMNTADGKPVNAVFGVLSMLLSCIDKFQPDYIACSLESDSPTFRHVKLPEYKGNRKEIDPELGSQIGEIINVIQSLGIKMLFKDGYEADDVIGSFAHKNIDKFDVIEIITGDRDLLQLLAPNVQVFMPGKSFADLIQYDRHKFKEKFGIELEDYVFYKSLVGDTSDNIKGVPGIGPKTAANIVNQFHTLESLLANLDQLSPRVAEAIEGSSNLLKDYYELCKIETDLTLEIQPEDTKISKMNVSRLRSIIDQYEFKSMTKRVAKFIDSFEKKYGGFGLFDDFDNSKDSYELEFKLVESVDVKEKDAYLLTTVDSWRIGNGNEFVDIPKNDIYNFIILNKPKKIIGFDLKPFIKALIKSGIKNIEAYEFYDLKLVWYLINSSIVFEGIPELCRHIKVNTLPEIVKITEEKVNALNHSELFELEQKMQIVLAHMENDGINVDKGYLGVLEKEYREKIADVKKQIFDFVGHEFNPASTKELGHILFEVLKLPVFKKNKTGYSTDDSTLTKLQDMSEIIPLIKKFRAHSKFLSTYLVGLQNYIDSDGKIHTTYNQAQVPTGRISSIDPNLQNIPADAEMGGIIRKAFKPEDGNIFLSLDYSQIDLRVLAYESQDENLINTFKNDEDIHTSTAKGIFEKEEISKQERNFAKTINFGIVYGMEPYGLSQALSIDQKKAKEFIDKYFEKYPKVKDYFNVITKQLDERGYVETFLGRRRYFEAWKYAGGPQKRALFREAINMPTQGGTAEIMKLAMVKAFETIQKDQLPVKLLLQIHDELVFEVLDKKQLEKIESKFKEIMDNVYDLGIPLKVSSKSGNDLSFE